MIFGMSKPLMSLANVCWDNFCSPDNPANSNYPALSHDASTFSISTAGLSGLVNENEIQGDHILPTHSTNC